MDHSVDEFAKQLLEKPQQIVIFLTLNLQK